MKNAQSLLWIAGLALNLISWAIRELWPKTPKWLARTGFGLGILLLVGALLSYPRSPAPEKSPTPAIPAPFHKVQHQSIRKQPLVQYAPNAVIATQNQQGNNTVNYGRQGRQITDAIKAQIDEYVKRFPGRRIEVRVDSSDEATEFGKQIRNYLLTRGVEGYIDPTSSYNGSFGFGLFFNPDAPIIGVGKNPD